MDLPITLSQAITKGSPLVVFYQWLLTNTREMNNILSLFEVRNGILYRRDRDNTNTQETLESIFGEFNKDRIDDKYTSVAGQDIIMDIFRQMFYEYYDTNSLVNPEQHIVDIIDKTVPWVKQRLRELIDEELNKGGSEESKSSITVSAVSRNVSTITE